MNTFRNRPRSRSARVHWVIGLGAALGLMLATEAAADPLDTQFAAMDTNRDGKVSVTEHAVGAQKMFEAMDTNRDGRVTVAEMDAAQAALTGRPPTSRGATSANKIAAVDRDADGRVSAEEHATGSREMFTMMDTDADGQLTLAELRAGHTRMMDRVSR